MCAAIGAGAFHGTRHSAGPHGSRRTSAGRPSGRTNVASAVVGAQPLGGQPERPGHDHAERARLPDRDAGGRGDEPRDLRDGGFEGGATASSSRA
ncbi:hypothetical protein, partial [Actinomadura sp. CNU-125]|uniref:hypothetical protein n=1 Tax=Actinomadura sp. CNU-125 TaxID=1904961 RepID=UPI0021CD0CDD